MLKTTEAINSQSVIPSSLAAGFGFGAANPGNVNAEFLLKGSALGAQSTASSTGQRSGGQNFDFGPFSFSFSVSQTGQVNASVGVNFGITAYDFYKLTIGSVGVDISYNSTK